MLHHVGSLNSRSIAPVTYMWKYLQSNFFSKVDNMNSSDEQQRGDSCALRRKYWLWIHPAGFREGYGVLESICERMKIDGHSVSCISLEGELAKLELIGLRAFQLIQKILHPITSVSKNSGALRKCSGSHIDGKALFKDTSTLPNEDEILRSAIISLMVNDPRLFIGNAVDSGPTFSEVLGTKKSKIQGSTLLEGIKVQKMDSPSSLYLKAEESCQFSEIVGLWDAHQRILPPVEESFLCKEKYRQSLKFFSVADENLRNLDASEERLSPPFSQICPLMLLKNNFCDGFTRWSIILPLSWVKVFWNAIVSNGAQAIGLRERHWIACEAGLPYFPADFPDSKAYSCFKEMVEVINDKKAKLQPLAVRPLRVPTRPPWKSVQSASKKESLITGDAKVLPSTDHSIKNLNCDLATFVSDDASFSGCVARTSYMLIQSLTHFFADHLLLFPKLGGGKKCLPMVIKEEKMINGVVSELKYDQKLCFVRVHLRAYKEGVFGDGAVVCAPHSTDISKLTTRTEDGSGICQIPESSLYSSCDQELEPQLPEVSFGSESCRSPIGFVTTGFVQGS